MNNFYERGDMWNVYSRADTFCITTNSFVRRDGSLVMGAGIARQARDRFDGLAQDFGTRIKDFCGHLGTYGILPAPNHRIHAFQVKHHWKDSADTELIKTAAKMLDRFGEGETHLNFPGIGNGGLDAEDVKPILETNLNNTHIWRYGSA